jgi:hypothetical protein
MAETPRQNTPAEFQRYAFANVAARMAQSQGDRLYIQGAVDLLSKNLDFGRDGKDLYDQYVTDNATSKLIDIYNKKYNAKLAEASVSDVYDWYKPALKGATPEQTALVDSEFGKFAGENYNKLESKIQILQYKANSPEGALSKEEKEGAQKELKKYDGFVMAQQLLSQYNYERMRMQAIEASKPHTFGGLEEILKPESVNREGHN